MSFSDSTKAFSVKLQADTKEVFVGVVSATHQSIVEGSPVTGAPGQPVDTGNLRASWQDEFVGPAEAIIATNVEYAPYVEENVRGVQFHNHGPHSVELTIAGFQQLVASETERITGGAP